jgi:hypothetical protein
MGDVGSAFLGYSFAVLPLMFVVPVIPLIGFLLVWPFVFDTVFTIIRRWRKGENIFTAHRSHLYQRLVIAGYPHRSVTLIYIGLAFVGAVLAVIWYLRLPGSGVAVLLTIPILSIVLWRLVLAAEQRVTTVAQSGVRGQGSGVGG